MIYTIFYTRLLLFLYVGFINIENAEIIPSRFCTKYVIHFVNKLLGEYEKISSNDIKP